MKRASLPAGWYNVDEFGAKGDGGTLSTKGVQKAIDACHERGGGTVLFPPGGRYVVGTIYLKSHVTLHVAANAALLGSRDLADYTTDTGVCPYYPEPLDRCLIFAKDARDIGLAGRGVIDGRYTGEAFRPVPGAEGREVHQRPVLIRFDGCENVAIQDLLLRGSAAWCTHLARCRNVRLNCISIFNDKQDGFNIESCEDVTISDCNLRCGDDGIALTTNPVGRPLRNLTVTNCIIQSRWAAVRIGPLSKGNFENIAVSNCVFHQCGGGGIKIGMYEGAEVRNCVFSNLVMDGVTSPVSIFLGTWTDIGSADEHPPTMPVGRIRHLRFQNIVARAIGAPGPKPDVSGTLFFQGHPECAIEDVTLSGVRVTFPGGGTKEHAGRRDMVDMDKIQPRVTGYWTENMSIWGVSPAYGLYARHLQGLVLRDVRFELAEKDERPAVFCYECEDGEMSGFQAACSPDSALIIARNCADVRVRDSRPLEHADALLRLEGKNCRAVQLSGNDPNRVGSVVDLVEGAPQGEVRQS